MKQEEKKLPDGLEEAAMAQYPKVWKEYPKDGIIRSEEYYDLNEDRRDAFIVGAEWQKVKDQELIELAEDHAMLAGMNKMEQQMMEKAVEGYVGVHLTEEGSKVTVNSGYLPKEMGIKNGDKIRIIIVKEDEK